ncbi:MAG: hypothetical protein PHT40_00230 [Patescibacteria group bacterium]|nr:hypothetical protein [Patescibacteria group bacterium]
MTLGKYLFLMTIATVLCLGALALVVFFVDPETSGTLGVFIFFAAAFFAAAGLASLIGFFLRYFFQKHEFAFIQVKDSFRQALWLAILIVVALFLSSQGLARWWNLLILVLILAALEMFWVSMNKNNNN